MPLCVEHRLADARANYANPRPSRPGAIPSFPYHSQKEKGSRPQRPPQAG